eukprot:363801-Chlamydomonas_euryale.AAC.10
MPDGNVRGVARGSVGHGAAHLAAHAARLPAGTKKPAAGERAGSARQEGRDVCESTPSQAVSAAQPRAMKRRGRVFTAVSDSAFEKHLPRPSATLNSELLAAVVAVSCVQRLCSRIWRKHGECLPPIQMCRHCIFVSAISLPQLTYSNACLMHIAPTICLS